MAQTDQQLQARISSEERCAHVVLPEDAAWDGDDLTFEPGQWISHEGISREALPRLTQLTLDKLDKGFEFATHGTPRIISGREIKLPYQSYGHAHALAVALQHSAAEAKEDVESR